MLDELLESNSKLQGREQEVRGFVASMMSPFRAELVTETGSALGSSTALLVSLRDGPFGAPETPGEEASSIAEHIKSACQQLQVVVSCCNGIPLFSFRLGMKTQILLCERCQEV